MKREGVLKVPRSPSAQRDRNSSSGQPSEKAMRHESVDEGMEEGATVEAKDEAFLSVQDRLAFVEVTLRQLPKTYYLWLRTTLRLQQLRANSVLISAELRAFRSLQDASSVLDAAELRPFRVVMAQVQWAARRISANYELPTDDYSYRRMGKLRMDMRCETAEEPEQRLESRIATTLAGSSKDAMTEERPDPENVIGDGGAEA